MVEGAALEMLFGGDFNEGSNPSLSVPNYFGGFVRVSPTARETPLFV